MSIPKKSFCSAGNLERGRQLSVLDGWQQDLLPTSHRRRWVLCSTLYPLCVPDFSTSVADSSTPQARTAFSLPFVPPSSFPWHRRPLSPCLGWRGRGWRGQGINILRSNLQSVGDESQRINSTFFIVPWRLPSKAGPRWYTEITSSLAQL